MQASQPNKYAALLRILHWAFIPFIIGSIVSGKVMTNVGFEDPLSYYLPQYHYLSGLILFSLLVARIATKITTQTPSYHQSISLLNIRLAKSVQILMLLCISVVLVSGYLLATADGNPAKLPWGTWLIQISPNDAFTLEQMLTVHVSAIMTFFGLLFLHAAGFIKHQFNDRTFIKRIL